MRMAEYISNHLPALFFSHQHLMNLWIGLRIWLRRRPGETMRLWEIYQMCYQPDWQKGQNVEGLRFSEVCSETRKHWKPFTTVHSWAVELSQADHSVLRLLQISQQHIEFLGWVKWSRRDSPVWVVGSLEKSIRVPLVSQKWGHNWSVWSMSVSFGRRWLNVANNNHFSVLGCSIIYVMDYGLSWHGNPGNHFPEVTVQYHQLHFRLALSMKEQTSAGPSQPFDSNQVAHLCKFLKIP